MNCFVDYRISNEELNNILKLNIEPILVPKCDTLYEAINGHVDIQLNILNRQNRTIIVQRNISKDFLFLLKKNNINYILSKSHLKKSYPDNILLNALILDKYFIHNLKFTDENLLSNQLKKKKINIHQGYTKCSVIPINEKALITSDKGIYNELIKYDFDILLLPPGDILLPSLDYGFIGGTGGMVNANTLVLFGELNHYLYGKEMYEFLYKYDVEPISLKRGKLIDRGSFLCI